MKTHSGNLLRMMLVPGHVNLHGMSQDQHQHTDATPNVFITMAASDLHRCLRHTFVFNTSGAQECCDLTACHLDLLFCWHDHEHSPSFFGETTGLDTESTTRASKNCSQDVVLPIPPCVGSSQMNSTATAATDHDRPRQIPVPGLGRQTDSCLIHPGFPASSRTFADQTTPLNRSLLVHLLPYF